MKKISCDGSAAQTDFLYVGYVMGMRFRSCVGANSLARRYGFFLLFATASLVFALQDLELVGMFYAGGAIAWKIDFPH